jgi:hypothetical protein
MQTIARILLTLTALGYRLATIKADFNKTHATNPTWTPHARFHVVWQILSYSGIGLIALALGVAVYGAFFTTVLARPLFGGSLYDENGYLPFKPPIGPQHWRWGVNVTAFTILSAILLAGLIAVIAS